LRYFGGSLFATTLFSSNIFFWLEAGYFDVAAERKPLLHTWSLVGHYFDEHHLSAHGAEAVAETLRPAFE